MLKHYGAAAGIVGGITLLQFANTVLSVILPLSLALNGYSGTTTGLVVTGYGLVDGRQAKLADIAAVWGITAERVRQIERHAIAKLRDKSIAA